MLSNDDDDDDEEKGRVLDSKCVCVVRACIPLPFFKLNEVALDYGTFIASSDAQVISYLGIPYAQPPTGANRFAPPKALEPSSKAFTANKQAPMCVQDAALTEAMSEDCLYLNVWLPANIKPSDTLPVVVYVHGNAYPIDVGLLILGKSTLATFPTEFLEKGLGNAGLADVNFVFEWVKKNIGKFGGDAPNCPCRRIRPDIHAVPLLVGTVAREGLGVGGATNAAELEILLSIFIRPEAYVALAKQDIATLPPAVAADFIAGQVSYICPSFNTANLPQPQSPPTERGATYGSDLSFLFNKKMDLVGNEENAISEQLSKAFCPLSLTERLHLTGRGILRTPGVLLSSPPTSSLQDLKTARLK
ncbi:Alpha/Beta hydrolase protein [Chytridium lagenaria]|nr:Alpha/Beta hydrolase protein [Chytridium lagenaria]